MGVGQNAYRGIVHNLCDYLILYNKLQYVCTNPSI